MLVHDLKDWIHQHKQQQPLETEAMETETGGTVETKTVESEAMKAKTMETKRVKTGDSGSKVLNLKPADDTTTKKSAPKMKPALGLTGKKKKKKKKKSPNRTSPLNMMIQECYRIDGCAAKTTFALKDPEKTIRETKQI